MTNPWDQRYNSTDFFYGTTPNSFLQDHAHLLKDKSKILCIGDGEGRNSVYLAKLNHDVTALDLSQVGLNKMLQWAEKNQVQVTPLLANLAAYQFEENTWDAIVSIWCHVPSQLRQHIHKGLCHSLKKEGLFILEAYTPKQLEFKTGGPQDVDMLVTQKELDQHFFGFQKIVAEEKIRSVHEGQGHNGKSAVVQFITQKK
jgi:cyclopropane fatty-acyl-phospholipid synthase-like methyltransferase